MFEFLIKKTLLRYARAESEAGAESQNESQKAICASLDENLKEIKNQLGDSDDIVIREILIDYGRDVRGALVFVDGLVDSKTINNNMIRPLMYDSACRAGGDAARSGLFSHIKNAMLTIGELSETTLLNDALAGVLSGDTLLLIDRIPVALVLNTRGWDKRGVDTPSGEAVIRGPKESFVESLRTNTALIRRKIKSPALTFESSVIGRRTKTSVSIAYLKGIAQPSLVSEVKKRLEAIDTDSILESGYIEQYIEDAPGSLFSTIGYTEKPDVAAAKLLEGRVAIIVDGTPFVLTAPMLFIESFQATEDYYFRPYFITLLRVTRAIAYLVSILFPALYAAITTFHQELVPTNLLLTMASAREGVPFPAFIESLLMVVAFGILQEAGVRLPRPVGQAMSIVGALVMGEAAVSAGLIGAPMVIVVAITAVSGFVIPNQNDSSTVLRILLLILGAGFGGFGVAMGLLATLVHMASLESFGYPYLSPIVPYNAEGSLDSIVRAPLWMMLRRPRGMAVDKQRKKFKIPPG